MADIQLRMSRTPDEPEPLQFYEMVVEVVSATGVPKEIFVFQRGVPMAIPNATPEPVDRFVSLADAVDLDDYPVNAPDLSNEVPYYRLKEVTLRFRALADLEETWVYIQQDVQTLVNAINTGLSETPLTEDVVIN